MLISDFLVSGKTPEEPVISTKSGHVYEKRLILKYLEANNNTDPVTGQQIEPTDLIDVKGKQTQRYSGFRFSKHSFSFLSFFRYFE